MNKGRLASIGAGMAAYNTGRNLYNDAREWYDSKTMFSASLSENAPIYQDVMRWVDRKVNPRRVRFVNKRSVVERIYDSNFSTKVYHDGFQYTVHLEKPDVLKSDVSLDLAESMASNVIFQCRQREGIDALERLFIEMNEKRINEKKEVTVSFIGSYGWNSVILPHRPMESVFLPSGEKEALLRDIDFFISTEKDHHKIGVPWHRGYLFYGPPGNGKSSITAAIAHHYKMNIFNMPLSSIKDDRQLAEQISSISPGSILLLEDIDIFSKAIGRTQSGDGPTLAGLLNALDGVSTPNGLLTIMTTNHEEVLDPALIRPGRISHRVHLTAPQLEQIEGMFEFVYGEALGVEPKKFDSMAQLAEVFKLNFGDPESARAEIKGE